MSVLESLPGPSFITSFTSESSYCPTSDTEDSSSEKEEIPFNKVCDYNGCGKTFKRSEHLERHVYHVHTQVKKYVCPRGGCDKRYIILSHLKRHIKTVHEKKPSLIVERIKCTIPLCERLFSTQTSLNRHIRSYHENKKIYKCTECDFSGSHKLQYVRHMQIHFPTQEEKKPCIKKYRCLKCEEVFSKWSELQQHQKTVHIPRCEVCDKTFSNRTNLRSHLRDHRMKALNESYPCLHPGCTRTYLQKRNLNAHYQTIHLNIRFKCPFVNCNSSFTSKRRLLRHQDLHGADDIVVERRPQAVRKDKGTKKVPTMSVLTGVKIEPQLGKLIVQGKGDAVELDYSSFVTTTDSDGEEIQVPSRFQVKLANKKETLVD